MERNLGKFILHKAEMELKMKKFSTALLFTLLFLFNTTTIKITAAADQLSQTIEMEMESESDTVSNSLTFTEQYSVSIKNGSKINFLTAKNCIYITSCNAQSINVNDLKEINIITDSSKILVNKNNSLTKGYIPKNLTSINPTKVKLEYSGLKLIPETTNALYSLVNAAKKSNVKGFIVNSAYRSENTQREIFNANFKTFNRTSKTYKDAYERTRKLVALPGNSEHQTGLAIDIFSLNGRHRNDFAGTKEQLWLNKNLYKYGFIIRYPIDKTKETDSTYEPWHIRYVGIPLSSYLYNKNLCLEEFYDKIFAGSILEDNDYLFMQINDNQKVFIDKTLLSQAKLETVKKGVNLLILKKN